MKSRITISIIFVIFALCSIWFLNSINSLEKTVKKDFINNKDTFVRFADEYIHKEGIIKKEQYDKNSMLLSKLFGELGYEFIRFDNNDIFFCKGSDGMSGIGLLYTEDINSAKTVKDTIIEIIEKNWYVFSEHYL